MAAQRQPHPEPQRLRRPPLRLVQGSPDIAAGELVGVEAVGPDFHRGLLWGLTVSTLGFWMPVATALYLWLR